MRRTLLRLVDRYGEERRRLAPLLAPGKAGPALASAFDRLVGRSPSTLGIALAVLCRRHDWRQIIALLHLAQQRHLPLRDKWYTLALEAAPDVASRIAAVQQLSAVWPEAPASHRRKSKLAEESSSKDLVVGGVRDALRLSSHYAHTACTDPTPDFSRYYMAQGVVQGPHELVELARALQQRPLTVVRIHQANPLWPELVKQCQGLKAMFPVPWYPSRLAWCLDPDHPERAERQRALYWIGAMTKQGLASFQSASSLIPPMLLAPGPSDAICDLCASPGSKASQIVDWMRGGARDEETGVLLANDNNSPRFGILRRRLSGLSPSVVLTQFDARTFPSFSPDLLFDRVLVDVTCSGDGLLHKRPTMWSRWSPANGLAFHGDQLRCLRRALALTKPGGLVVYSTCTLNPLENEAVVAAAVADGSADIVNPGAALPPALPPLSEGLASWVVPTHTGQLLSDPGTEHRLAPTLFPPNSPQICRSLRHCRRILPHLHQGMGAFFVALLRRNLDNPSLPITLLPPSSEQAPSAHYIRRTENQKAPTALQPRPFTLISGAHPALQKVAAHFGIQQWPPSLRFACRTLGQRDGTQIHALSSKAARFVQQAPLGEAVSGMHEAGTCIVALGSNSWELMPAGASLLAPLSARRVVHFPFPLFQFLLGAGTSTATAMEEMAAEASGGAVPARCVEDCRAQYVGPDREMFIASVLLPGASEAKLSLPLCVERRRDELIFRFLVPPNVRTPMLSVLSRARRGYVPPNESRETYFAATADFRPWESPNMHTTDGPTKQAGLPRATLF